MCVLASIFICFAISVIHSFKNPYDLRIKHVIDSQHNRYILTRFCTLALTKALDLINFACKLFSVGYVGNLIIKKPSRPSPAGIEEETINSNDREKP